MRQSHLPICLLLSGLLLTGCGGESDLGINTGVITLSVTDAPIDQATAVWVEFSGVELKPKEGEPISISFDSAKQINLLDLQGSDFAFLLDQHTIRAGEYNWIRLQVNAEPAVMDSYIEFEGGGTHPLRVPSGSESGLKLSRGFTLPANREIDLTIDFDLRKSIVAPSSGSDYLLKPSLRLVQTDTTGHIMGTVSAGNFSDVNCTGSDYAIYVFQGADVIPDDIDGIDAEPVTTALLDLDTYQYSVGFLIEGDYTISFTCNALDDVVESDDALNFIGTSNVTVEAKNTITHNF